jgi:hypothetical protein
LAEHKNVFHNYANISRGTSDVLLLFKKNILKLTLSKIRTKSSFLLHKALQALFSIIFVLNDNLLASEYLIITPDQHLQKAFTF